MKWRRLTRLEGMLLGALLELTEGKAPARDGEQPMCCKGLVTIDACGRCGPLLRGKELADKVLAMQRSRKPRPTPAPRGAARVGWPGLDGRARNVIERCGGSIEQVAEIGRPHVLGMKNAGRATVQRLEAHMRANGLWWAGETPPADDGRGGHRVGERRQAARTVHIIDADSSARDIELARSDLANFFGDVLDKHHGGSF